MGTPSRSLCRARERLFALLGLAIVAVAVLSVASGARMPGAAGTAAAAAMPTDADGQGVPDSGKQRMIMVEELRILNAEVKSMNERLAAIDKALRAGEYKLQVQGAAKGEVGR